MDVGEAWKEVSVLQCDDESFVQTQSFKDHIVDNAEMSLFLGFLAAEGSRNDGCLYRAVCLAPEHGAEYMKAGKALLEGFGVFDP